MDEDFGYGYYKNRSGQIPAFGDWDNYANDLPITQYFECARQAGLIRYSLNAGECDPRSTTTAAAADHYAPPRYKTRAREKRCQHVKEQKEAGGICDARKPPTWHRHAGQRQITHKDELRRDDGVSYPRPPAAAKAKAPKAVDEDLYKIPPELLRSSDRKKRLGFIARCLVPACSA